MSLIYFGPDMNIIKRDLPKMVVDQCGCPWIGRYPVSIRFPSARAPMQFPANHFSNIPKMIIQEAMDNAIEFIRQDHKWT